jgi:hypothetical protein
MKVFTAKMSGSSQLRTGLEFDFASGQKPLYEAGGNARFYHAFMAAANK